ncbi:MAG: cobalt transporter [Methanomicrobiales archaeon HGW-Methanomicrobiales-4]|nr:MAG: cobalt transporter [Methanomicrobiales archaeon HGW-Methanomicrobiales-4]
MAGRRLELITGVVLVIFIALFLYTSETTNSEFSGADSVASGKIAEITGIPEEQFTPLIGQWQPPSGEIESLLFALQTTFGGIILGLVFGFWLGQRKSSPVT